MAPADVQSGPHAVPSDERSIARLPVPATDETRYWHDTIPGLYLRIRAGGSRTWVLQFRSAGMKRKITLGRSPAMTSPAAVAAARVNLAQLAVGANPAQARVDAKAKVAAAVPLLSIIEDYLAHASQKVTSSYLSDTRRYLTRDLKPLHCLAAGDLTTEAMAKALAKVKKATAHNRAKAALTAFLKYAAGKGLVKAETYYAARMLPANAERGRDRVLSFEELARIWEAADTATAGDTIIRLLMLTGLRKSEIGGLHSREVDCEKDIISIGAERMKAGAKLVVPLTRTIGALLPERNGYLFGKTEAAPFSGWSRVKDRIDSRTKDPDGNQMEPWVVHDFRHTISTHLNEQRGANPDLIDRLLAHKRKGTERLYNHAQLIDAKRELLLKWEALLRAERVITDG
jgi:integrase